jgi:hypothetical protein
MQQLSSYTRFSMKFFLDSLNLLTKRTLLFLTQLFNLCGLAQKSQILARNRDKYLLGVIMKRSVDLLC